jgi:ribosomal protein S18 acetylase RimI-like enzyme
MEIAKKYGLEILPPSGAMRIINEVKSNVDTGKYRNSLTLVSFEKTQDFHPGATSKANTDRFTDTFSPLSSVSDPSFKDFLRIYKESLSIREQKSAAQISAMITRPDYQLYLLKRNAVTIGFSMVFAPPKESFCLLEYFAVDAAFRNQGLGHQLFLRSVDSVFSKNGQIPMLLEVDSDREPSADQPTRKRRQQFYRRLNCLRINNLSYMLPLPGEGPPPQMDLMVYFKGSAPLIGRNQLKHWLKLIYHDVYGCSVDDPRIIKMLETVGDPVVLV